MCGFVYLDKPKSVDIFITNNKEEGQSMIIKCESEANPATTLQLYNNSKKLGYDEIGQKVEYTVKLTKMMNKGLLHCKAKSSDSENLEYTIQSLVKILIVQCKC